MLTVSAQTFPRQVTNADRIYASNSNRAAEEEIRNALDDLLARGALTYRDERMLEYLREFNVLSIDQARRLFWPVGASERTVYFRLRLLVKSYLVDRAPLYRRQMELWGLSPGVVYTLGAGGRLWLRHEVSEDFVNRHLKQDQVTHDLLAAEFCTRLTEQVLQQGPNWSLTIAGPRSAGFYAAESADKPLIAPDVLAVVRHEFAPGKVATLPLFLEMDASREAHGRASSAWGRKVGGYDDFRRLDWAAVHPHLAGVRDFPRILVVTRGHERLLNLATAINEHRHGEVIYYLGLWSDVLASSNLLTDPIWIVLSPDGKLSGAARDDKDQLTVVAAERRALLSRKN